MALGVTVFEVSQLPLKVTPRKERMSTDIGELQRSVIPYKSKARRGLANLGGLWRNLHWWAHQDLNLGPAGYEPEALPTEL